MFMIGIEVVSTTSWRKFGGLLRLYGVLSKGRLSFWVSVSSLLAYFFVAPIPQFSVAVCLFMGGFLVAAASSTFNQWIEREYDSMMSRTRARPLPTGQLDAKQAISWGILSATLGLLILYVGIGPLVAFLSLVSLLLYVCVYTPMKRVGPIAVLMGAIPGAMPPLLGCLSAGGAFVNEGLLLFGIQFIWQFPHFWAIAWLADQDYQRAGFKLLPTGKKSPRSAAHLMLYAFFLLPTGLLPSYLGICGLYAAWIVLLAGLAFVLFSFLLFLRPSKKAALHLMWASFIYLPLVQITYVLDKT